MLSGDGHGVGTDVQTTKGCQHEGIFGGDGAILYLDRAGEYPTLCICQNPEKCTLERVNFAVHEFKNKRLKSPPYFAQITQFKSTSHKAYLSPLL